MQTKPNLPNPQSGFALLSSLILLFVMAAVAAAIFYSTISERSNAGTDMQKNTAYYASEAAMEKMTTDLGTLYSLNKAPNIAQIAVLTGATYRPNVINAGYQEYNISVPPNPANPTIPLAVTHNITSGSNAGLVAQIINMQLQSTAQTGAIAQAGMIGTPGEQVRMTRDIEVALIPVFQFGIFSQSDLSFFPGPAFDFNGRVFTNGNLFLADDGGLTFHSKVQAVGEVVRTVLANGVDATPRVGAVNIPTSPNGCDGAAPSCRNLLQKDESVTQFFTKPVPNPNWVNLSTSIYKGMLQNGTTGATALNLPFVKGNVSPYEIIRRPPSAEPATSLTGTSRLFNQAQIRILLDDNPANLPGGQKPTDVNLSAYSTAVNGVGTQQFMAQGIVPKSCPKVGATTPPCTDPSWFNPTGVQNVPWPLISGWLRVEYRDAAGNYNDITQEWLGLGFARQAQESAVPAQSVPNAENGIANTVHPSAILLFQYPASTAIYTPTAPQYGWYPINMYDPREGEVRDTVKAAGSCAVAGVFNLIELDMDNLRRWLNGTTGVSGQKVETASQNGYIVYFSDRRGMQLDTAAVPAATELNGEYGFEDIINIANATGTPNGVIDTGEDVNGNGRVDTYGIKTIGDGFGVPGADANPYTGAASRITCATTGRVNRVSGPRHAIKVINGSLGHVPVLAGGTGGTTIASENPVYVQGNYNANAAGFGASAAGVNEAASAVIADSVTLLSISYTDLRGLQNPTNLAARPGATSYYRLAIAGGKNINFPTATTWVAAADYGTDGGAHNFLKYIESWNGTSNYEGSLVSFFYSRQAVGVFKCCTVVYGAPNRNYSFDTNFLDPAKMPPGTPRFEDIDNLGYHQDYRPQ
ncbi:MAG TPA: hypothetical protein VGJ33_03345 [Candidatus Angelobacter sp.]|jgi:Tfp pilus assembly protein PilX